MTDPRALAYRVVAEIRREHQPNETGRQCKDCGENYPCDVTLHADAALDRLEARGVSAATPAAE